MTDGIIQEVFNPLIKWHTSHNDTDFANTLKLIEKELIEKIKQEFLSDNDAQLIEIQVIREILIGDSQE